jgi:signal peptidase I
MENTLQIQDRVLVNKIVYDFRDPERGEILVFEAPDAWRAISAEKEYIKRVIAVGGDRVVCCDDAGRISINGTPLDEPYIHRNEAGIVDPASRNVFDVVIPNGRLWVMGDHRSASSDSRENFCRFLRIDDGWTDEAVARAAVDAAVVAATIPVDSVVGKAFVLFWPLSRFTWLTVPDTFDNIAAPGSDPRPQPGLEEIKDLCRTPASLGG